MSASSLKLTAWGRPDMNAMMHDGYDPAVAMWILRIWEKIPEPKGISPDLYVGLVSRLGNELLQAKTMPQVRDAILRFRTESFAGAGANVEYSDAVPQMRAIGLGACNLINPANFHDIMSWLSSQYRIWGDVKNDSSVANEMATPQVYDAAPTAFSEAAADLMATTNLSERDFLFDGRCTARVGNEARYDRRTRTLILPPDGAGAAIAWFEALDWMLYEDLLPGSEFDGPLTRAIDGGANGGGHPLVAAMREVMDVMRSKAETGDALMLASQQKLMVARKTFDSAITELVRNAASSYGRERADLFVRDIRFILDNYSEKITSHPDAANPQDLVKYLGDAWKLAFNEPMSAFNRLLAEAPAHLLQKSAQRVAKIRGGQITFMVGKTRFMTRANRMDEASRKEIWSTPSSLAARAFMAWAEDAAGKMTYTSGPAFPDGVERERINGAMKSLINKVVLHLNEQPARQRKPRHGLA